MHASVGIRLRLNVLRPIALIATVGAAGCEQPNEYVAPPPPDVTVAQPQQREVVDYLAFTGTTQATESVEIRARVRGFLQSVNFEPGGEVEEGDLLFVIDPKPFQAQLDSAKANLASAEAQLTKAESDYRRKAEAGKRGAVTEADVVGAKADRDAAQAAVAAAQAAVTEAELKLGYTQVTAPISGRIGRNLVDVGNLVGDGQATLLATIAKYDPMYAYFNLNERDLLRLMSKNEELGEVEGKEQDVVLQLALANETGFPHEGRLDFADLGVDPATGTILLRGTFANPPPYVLIPGLFVRIRLPIATHEDALLVTERALGSDQSGRYLLVVNSENVVEKRLVTVGAAVDTLRVIESDLRPDDWVVIDGIQRARPGAKVNPQRAAAAPASDSQSAS